MPWASSLVQQIILHQQGLGSQTKALWLIVLGFNDTLTIVGHFVSSPREREKSDRKEE